jgi:hypothetical protein
MWGRFFGPGFSTSDSFNGLSPESTADSKGSLDLEHSSIYMFMASTLRAVR